MTIPGQTSRSRALSISAGGHHFVYFCYDADERLLYVGCTNNIKRRISQHEKANSGGALASRVLARCMARYEVSKAYPDRDAAQRVESHAIYEMAPLLNVHSASRPSWMVNLDIATYLEGRGIAIEEVGLRRCESCARLQPYRAEGSLCGDCQCPEIRALILLAAS